LKLQTIITSSEAYIQSFYSSNQNLKDRSYQEQYEALSNDKFGGSEIWATGLLEYGYKSNRVFINIPQIQNKWAELNGISCRGKNALEEITKEQIAKYQPEILFINNYNSLSSEFVNSIREEVSSIRLIIGWLGSTYHNADIFREFDLILSNIPELVDELIGYGYCCYHLNHAIDPRVLKNIDLDSEPKINFSFIGSIVKSDGYHQERENLLLDLIKATDLEIWSNVKKLTYKKYLQVRLLQTLYDAYQFGINIGLFNTLGTKNKIVKKLSQMKERPDFINHVDPAIVRHAHQPIFGLQMFQKLRDSKVTLNNHADVSPKSASNMRLFEATGVGTCLLTDWKENLHELFEPDSEVITYQTSGECIAKVNYLIENESERKRIADAGQIKALEKHSIYHRAEQLDAIIREHIRRHNL